MCFISVTCISCFHLHPRLHLNLYLHLCLGSSGDEVEMEDITETANQSSEDASTAPTIPDLSNLAIVESSVSGDNVKTIQGLESGAKDGDIHSNGDKQEQEQEKSTEQ